MESQGAGSTEKPGHIQMVTAVGNAWLMSRSKSHNGRVYYFNTATGEAVWNLTDEEFEKAKACPKVKWESRSGILPEPKGPPGDLITPASHTKYAQHPQESQYETPKVYNKQIINNQFTRAAFSPFVASWQNCHPLNPVQNIVGVTPQPPFNPVWVQPPPVFFTSPPNTVEHACHQQEFHQGFPAQKTSMTLSRRFGFANQQHKNFINRPQSSKFKRQFKNFNARKQPFISKTVQAPKNISDLRTKLAAKKISQENIPNEAVKNNETNVQECVTSDVTAQGLQKSSTFEGRATQDASTKDDDDDEWLKIHGNIDGAKLKLDTTVLKNFATDNLECECWYIVADKNVLLNHFNFLNVLTNSDAQCRLMVARGEMSALQAAARADTNMLGARKVWRGLSQLFAAKLAVIAEYSFEPSEIKDCSGMINFCAKLLEQNEHLILLTDEEGSDKHSTKVPTFSIPEVKELLIGEKYKICTPIIERNIEITIPNYVANDEPDEMETPYDNERMVCDVETAAYNEDMTTNHDETVIHDTRKKDSIIENLSGVMDKIAENTASSSIITAQKYAHKKYSPNKKETIVQTDNLPYTVQMVDAEVQTEPRFDILYPNIQKGSIGVNTVEDSVSKVLYVDKGTSVDKIIGFENITISNNVPETREIRLKRSISNQTARSANENTHYKWHRKNGGNSILSDSTSSFDRVSRMSNARSAHEPCQSRCQSTQLCYEYEDSESCSCISQKRAYSENIVIEETSNSESNDYIETNKSKADEAQSKNVMFEITSKAMELNLKMRCDEWLAQFIQIMEEVLGQVLREWHVASMPPPWVLHEAAECVKRMYSNDSDVVDAATKLSQVIYRMSDARGKIIVQFKPNDFMELYSYGVYLVDALQSINEKFDDLQIAAESLAKLLSDIENPIGDSNHNISFDDATDVSIVVSQNSADGQSLSDSNKSTHAQNALNKCSPTEKQDTVNKSTPTEKQCGMTKSIPSEKQGGVNKSTPTEKQCVVTKSIPSEKQGGANKSTPTEKQCGVTKSIPSVKQGGANKSTPTEKQCGVTKSIPSEKQGGSNKSTPTEKQGSVTKSNPTEKQVGVNTFSHTEKQNGLNKATPTTPREIVKPADTDNNKSPGKYNLRSARKKKIEEDKVDTLPVKFIRKVNLHDDFFKSLHLQRKEGKGTATVSKIFQENANTNIVDKEKMPTNKSPKANKPADKGPNIIRNFTRCLEFEERLKNQPRQPLDMDMLDYSMCHDENDNMEDTYSDEYDQNPEHSIEERREGIFVNDVEKSSDINNNDFKVFISSLVNEFRETIASVQRFCKKVQEEMQFQRMQTSRKSEVYNKALNAKSRIQNVCDSFRKIKEYDFNQHGDRLQLRLKEAGVLLNENEVLMYREVIDSCVGHGDTLAESLNLIIDAVNS